LEVIFVFLASPVSLAAREEKEMGAKRYEEITILDCVIRRNRSSRPACNYDYCEFC